MSMRSLLLVPAAAVALLAPPNAPPPVHSFVVRADSARGAGVRATAYGAVRSVVDSATPTLAKLEIHVTSLAPGQSPHAPHRHAHEEILVVTRGTLEVTQEGTVRRAPAGSVIFEASNELHGMRNVGADTAQYYVVRVDPRDLPAESRAPNGAR
jgi:XRE family transcriptional regulator, regulator of sulfur utilization